MFEKERAEIDIIDRELVKLFERRMDAVTEIARIKKEHKLPILDQSREDKVLDKVRRLTENKAYEDSVEDLFRSLMTITKALETKQNEKKKGRLKRRRGKRRNFSPIRFLCA